jgi:hypothetical protein
MPKVRQVEKRKVHLASSRDFYCSLPSWKAAMENMLVSRVNIVI